MKDDNICGKGIWNVKIWIVLGLAFSLLSQLTNLSTRTPYWLLEFIIYALMLFGLWANSKFSLRKRICIPKSAAPVVYIFLVWGLGMLYEMTLTVDGTGIGGVNRNTLASFVLAQGDYLLIAIFSFWIIRKLHLSFREAFFLAGGKSLTEGLVFTGVLLKTIISPSFFLSPLVLSYYTLVYASFIALPLLYVDEELLWKNAKPKPKRSIILMWIIGFVVALAIRMFWGLVYAPVVTRLFNLPSN